MNGTEVFDYVFIGPEISPQPEIIRIKGPILFGQMATSRL